MKPLEVCDDGHIDVSLMTSVLKRKQKHDEDLRRHLLMFKPRTNQKDVHNPTLLREVGIKEEKNRTQSERNKKTEHR